LIYELIASGLEVQIWTVCSGDPPHGPLSPLAEALQARWRTDRDAPAVRREEDRKACSVLGVQPLHLSIPECIYRRRPADGQPLINTNEELFQPLPEIEKPLVNQVAGLLADRLEDGDRLVSPLAIGGHVDHHLVRSAAESLQRPLHYYGDYPYLSDVKLNGLRRIDSGWQTVSWPVSSQGLAAW
jgi:LmbE family N-acetylglucosaminyl deacetylase